MDLDERYRIARQRLAETGDPVEALRFAITKSIDEDYARGKITAHDHAKEIFNMSQVRQPGPVANARLFTRWGLR